MEKVSYALGLSIGNNLISSGIKNLNFDKFASAVQTVINGGQPEMTYDEAKQVLDKYFRDLAQEINSKNKEVGKAFLAENKTKEGIIETASGLQYQVLKEGTGKKPSATSKVECHYEGYLLDGTIFDSSVKRGQTATFGLNQVIKGWTEGLQLMAEGAKYKFFIPSDLAYGEQGAGAMIPPHATLIFDVELIKVL